MAVVNREFRLVSPSGYRLHFATDTMHVGNEIGRWVTIGVGLYALSRRCHLGSN